MHHTQEAIACGRRGPRLPNGGCIGAFSVEDGEVVWTRHVSLARHLLRIRDAWTLNEPILEQLRAFGVGIIRYITGDITYEITLSEFIDSSGVLQAFACGENVYYLSRSKWRTESNTSAEFLPLFVMGDG